MASRKSASANSVCPCLSRSYQLQSRLMRADERDAYEPETGERILRVREVVRRCGISKRTIYRLEAVGRFPARRQLGPRAVGWAGFSSFSGTGYHRGQAGLTGLPISHA